MSTVEIRRNKAGDVSYRVRFRHDGKHLAKTFVSEDKARTWKALLDATSPAKALAALDASPASKTTRTVAQQVRHHITHLTGVTEGTRKRYLGYLERRIEPDPLGALPLDLADRDAYAAWVNRLADAGLSAKTMANHHSLLSHTLSFAVREGLIPANHAEGIRIATPDEDDADEMVTLDLPELRRFILATPEHWRPMVVFMFGTGVRWQEAAALKAKDVDLGRLQARIVRAWKDTAGNGHKLGKPKSKRSRRTIVFGAGVAAAIRPLVQGRDPEAFVFTNTRGGPVRYGNFWEDVWAKAVRVFAGDTPVKTRPASGKGRSRVQWAPGPGKRPTPHDARHTYASLQIAQGKGMPFLQRQLGHESINTTINLYTHLETRDLRILSDVIEGALGLPAS